MPRVSRVDLGLLKGIDRMRDILIENTERFADGLPANNALLWGARGMGKSSLVKAAHASINVNRKPADRLKLIEIHREDIESLPALMDLLRASDFHFIVFCDDLSFDGNDASYKSLKAVLEGGIEGRPDNVILYATSNRRHLLARDMIENERSTAINPGEAVEEKVSLSDRFGLWLGFHRCSQDEYLAMVKGYCGHFGIKLAEDELEREALEWSTTRGSRSGRVAWQFTQELAGRLGREAEREVAVAYAALATDRHPRESGDPVRRGFRFDRSGSGILGRPVKPGDDSCVASAASRSRPVEELKRVNRRRSLADLEVELRRPHLARLTRFGNDLAALDRVAALHQQFTRMGICGDVTVGVPNQNQIAVTLEFISGIGDDAVFRRLHRRAFRHRQIDAVIRPCRWSWRRSS